MKRGERDKNRCKRTRCTHYYDEILLISGIDIVEDTDHKHSSAINHQLPEKTLYIKEVKGIKIEVRGHVVLIIMTKFY